MIVELGIEIISFLIVRTRVTSIDFSITSPTISPILTRSPILNKRIYVNTRPATILESEPADPNVNKKPKNTETPLNTGESLPGKYGKITTIKNANNNTRTI